MITQFLIGIFGAWMLWLAYVHYGAYNYIAYLTGMMLKAFTQDLRHKYKYDEWKSTDPIHEIVDWDQNIDIIRALNVISRMVGKNIVFLTVGLWTGVYYIYLVQNVDVFEQNLGLMISAILCTVFEMLIAYYTFTKMKHMVLFKSRLNEIIMIVDFSTAGGRQDQGTGT